MKEILRMFDFAEPAPLENIVVISHFTFEA
jgi:hypothetical protein